MNFGVKNILQLLPGDPAALTGLRREVLPDASHLRAMGAEPYWIVRENVNLVKMVGVFIEALNRVRN